MEDLQLAENQVDIWQIDASAPLEIRRFREWLSPDETERADRFHFEKHRCRFIVMRAAMREILGRYTGLRPREVVFSYSAKGKPELLGQEGKGGIRFNLSHADELALLAVSQGLAIGIDIESVRPEFAGQEIAERFFSAGEVRRLLELPAEERPEAFFSCWTRKEAYIKALGEGLSVPLDSFEVAFGPDTQASLLAVEVNPRELTRWSMYDLAAPEGCKAALVVEGSQHRLRRVPWTPSISR